MAIDKEKLKNQTINLKQAKIHLSTSFEELYKYIKPEIPEHFKGHPGKEAYKLYADISQSLAPKTVIADLGTYQGLSALALSINPKVNVISYDVDLSYNLVSQKENIKFIEDDIFSDRAMEQILNAQVILVDVDPHDGIQEKLLYDILLENKYSGITYWDDIHLNTGMQSFWDSVDLEKEDLTEIGHHSGTGKVIFPSW